MLRLATSPGNDEPYRAATQLKLFFDFISVIATAGLTAAFCHLISEGHYPDRTTHSTTGLATGSPVRTKRRTEGIASLMRFRVIR